MALGKVRTSKRASSSSSSYASTITTAVFIAVCVLGVWMLTTNSVVPPQTTTRTATAGADLRTSATTSPKETQSFEDTQGDLPDDALKSDDRRGAAAAEQRQPQPKSGGTTKQYSTAEVETATTDQQADARESVQEAAVDETSLGKESTEEVKQQQMESAAHVSEERSATQKERAEETTTNKEQNNNDLIQDTDSSSTNNGDNNDENQSTDRNHKSDEPKADQESKTSGYNADSDGDSNRSDKTKDPEAGQEEVFPRQDNTSAEAQQEESSSAGQEEATTNDDDKAQQNDTSDEAKQAQTADDVVDRAQVEADSQSHDSEQSKQSPMQEPKPGDGKPAESKSGESTAFPGGENSGIPKESTESKKSWKTQKDQSENQKERRKDDSKGTDGSIYGYTWQLCNVTAGADYIPCLDNERAISKLRSRGHYEHRERHCPEEGPTCLVPLPEGYKTPIQWPTSRDKIWYHNVPHTLLAEVKGHQNWVKVTGEFLTFPGGGTQFIHGALHYIDFLQSSVRGLAWGKNTRVILDVGCGVASFGGFLFERGVLAMSFAPKDEHEAQVQFALERGIPAISAVMGTQRLPFPSRVFDLVHCARCRVPWHAEGGMLLLELNRVLRPGGLFVWSATPVYQKLPEDVEIWKEMSALTKSMCWEIVTIQRDRLNSVGAAIYRKPTTNHCYDQRKHKRPPMCKADDDANAAWYVPLQACMHRAPVESTERGTNWPDEWPRRLQTTPYWLNSSQMGIYGKPAPKDFATDYEHWNRVVNKLYLNGLGISWSNVRNVMDMRAVYGGFASAMKDLKVWVMNVVNVDSPDTLPIIFERGLLGIYHDWCESFSTYPRTYDLLHADHLFSRLTKRCKLAPVMAEIDRIARPGGKLIVRDESGTVGEVENLLKSLHWEVHLTFSKDKEGILSAQKSDWRPTDFAASS